MPEWNHLVGKSADEAKQQILADMPNANVVVLPQNSPTTRDFRVDRVRVFVDGDNKVAVAPRPG